jgi:hypothetical protein
MPETVSSVATSHGGSRTDSSPFVPPINLPKRGGAIRGIREKFSANPVTGTGKGHRLQPDAVADLILACHYAVS